MSVIGEFTVDAAWFALGEALRAHPDTTVRADTLATHSTMEVLPFLWASGGDLAAFRDAVAADPSVVEVTEADQAHDALLLKLRWSESVVDVIDEMVDHHAAVVEARGRGEAWRLKLRFTGDEQVSAFQNYFAATGRGFEVHRLYHPTEPRARAFDLTPEQHETLLAALEEGYFRVPRETTVAALGERLGVSANAVSQRLRRGCEALVANALVIEADDVR